MLVIVLVTGKSVPVQAGLWLLPLIALVGLQWRDHLIWAGFEAAYFVAVWLYIGGLSKPERGLPARGYSALLLLRLAALLFVLIQVWRVARSRPAVGRPEPADEDGADARQVEAQSVDQDVVDAERVDAEQVDVQSVNAESVNAESVDQDDVGAEQVDEVDPLAGPMAGAPDQVLVRFG
jgi:hypothetical protein